MVPYYPLSIAHLVATGHGLSETASLCQPGERSPEGDIRLGILVTVRSCLLVLLPNRLRTNRCVAPRHKEILRLATAHGTPTGHTVYHNFTVCGGRISAAALRIIRIVCRTRCGPRRLGPFSAQHAAPVTSYLRTVHGPSAPHPTRAPVNPRVGCFPDSSTGRASARLGPSPQDIPRFGSQNFPL